MPKNFSCNLSSINLSNYVVNPFTEKAAFDFHALAKDVPIYIKNADKIIDECAPFHALKEQRINALNYRNVGIGIMGLGSMFIKLRMPFGSQESITFASKLMSFLFREAVQASSKLALIKGSFPKYDPAVFDSEIIKNHFTSEEIKILKNQGLRNCSLLSIAPTGSIGTMLGISTGAEAWFSSSYMRKTVSLNTEEKYYKVEVPIFKEAREAGVPENVLVTVQNIPWKNRVDLQAALQESVDTAISSTCNLSKETTLEQVEQIYLYAWKKGLKGLTIFRDGCRDGVLVTSPKEPPKPFFKFDSITPISRKQLGTTTGSTFCKKCACGTLYITANRDSKGNLVEVFTHTSKGGICQANMNAVTRMISLSLRSGVKIDEIEDQLKGINCPACSINKAKGLKIDGLSCPDIISRTIKEFLSNKQNLTPVAAAPVKVEEQKTESKDKCPECGEPLIMTSGCVQCTNCGWSKCS